MTLPSLLFSLSCCVAQVSGNALSGITTQPHGYQSNNDSGLGRGRSISPDGRWVSFTSRASNLAGGHGLHRDAFLWDRWTNTIELVAIPLTGAFPSSESIAATVDSSGRFVLFDSPSNNLVPNDTNFHREVFIRDRTSGLTTRESFDANGNLINGGCHAVDMDDSATWIAFQTREPNVVAGDTNTMEDVFIRNRITGQVLWATRAFDGSPGNAPTYTGRISADGNWFAFSSSATNLVPSDTNGVSDVFLVDLTSQAITRINLGNAGAEANGTSTFNSISADGRWIVYSSAADNLVLSGDTNGVDDVFLYDRFNGTTSRGSLGPIGQEADAGSYAGSISDDGQYLVFASSATNFDSVLSTPMPHVYQRNMTTGAIVRVSQTPSYGLADQDAYPISNATGDYVLMVSLATNLVTNDTNGQPDLFLASAGELYEYGASCAGSGGFVPHLVANGPPTAGSWIEFSVLNGLGGAAGYFYIGLGQTNVPLGNGCSLLIDPILPNPVPFVLGGAGAGNGTYSIGFQISPTSGPGSLTIQAFLADPGATPGSAQTNGLQYTVP